MRRDAHTILTQMAALVAAYAGWGAVFLCGGGSAPLVAPAVAIALYAITIDLA